MQSRRDFLRNRFPRIHKLASGRMREPRMRVNHFVARNRCERNARPAHQPTVPSRKPFCATIASWMPLLAGIESSHAVPVR